VRLLIKIKKNKKLIMNHRTHRDIDELISYNCKGGEHQSTYTICNLFLQFSIIVEDELILFVFESKLP
jgi:hypothetical protein